MEDCYSVRHCSTRSSLISAWGNSLCVGVFFTVASYGEMKTHRPTLKHECFRLGVENRSGHSVWTVFVSVRLITKTESGADISL